MSKLSDIKIKALKPKEKIYRAFDGQGLYIEVSSTGSKYWRLKYRIFGKERRMALGVYPEVNNCLVGYKEKREVKKFRRPY